MPSNEFECQDIIGNWVICTKERWRHVLEEHPELDERQELVKNAIIKPDFICSSRLGWGKYTFYKSCYLSKLKNYMGYLRIVVKYNGGIEWQISGRITKKFKGRLTTVVPVDGTQMGEVMIWRGQAI